MLTVKEVADRIEVIKQNSGDPEAAHSMEDSLHEEVLQAIVDGHETPGLLAKEALRTRELTYDRWYA